MAEKSAADFLVFAKKVIVQVFDIISRRGMCMIQREHNNLPNNCWNLLFGHRTPHHYAFGRK